MERRRNISAKRKGKAKKRQKRATGGSRGMRRTEAPGIRACQGWRQPAVPRSRHQTPCELALTPARQELKWKLGERRRLDQRTTPMTTYVPLRMRLVPGVCGFPKTTAIRRPKKSSGAAARDGLGIRRWTRAGHPQVPSAPAGEGLALQPEPKLWAWGGTGSLLSAWALSKAGRCQSGRASSGLFGRDAGPEAHIAQGGSGLPSPRPTGEVGCPNPLRSPVEGSCLQEQGWGLSFFSPTQMQFTERSHP